MSFDPYDPENSGYEDGGATADAGKLLHGVGGSLLYRSSDGKLVFADRRMVAKDSMFYLDMFVRWTSGKDLDICVWYEIATPDNTSAASGCIGWGHTSEASVSFNGKTIRGYWDSGDNTDYNGEEHISFSIPMDILGTQNQALFVIYVAGNYYEIDGGSASVSLSSGTRSRQLTFTPKTGNNNHRAEQSDYLTDGCGTAIPISIRRVSGNVQLIF